MKVLIIMLCFSGGSVECRPYMTSKPMDGVSCESARALYERILSPGNGKSYKVACR